MTTPSIVAHFRSLDPASDEYRALQAEADLIVAGLTLIARDMRSAYEAEQSRLAAEAEATDGRAAA